MAVEEIGASCQSYTVTSGTGEDKRTETRYRCVLHGLGAAESAIERWCAGLVKERGARRVFE